jgi:hypothetical protein
MSISIRFGKARVKRGLIHFLVGKTISALAGLLAMVFVVRGLSIADFAAYSVLIALVEVFTAVSGLGLAHVVLRYVPELYATHRSASLRSVILSTLGIRSSVLVAALLLAYVLVQPLAQFLKLNGVLAAFELFMLVVALRSTSHFLSQILESTLHQGISQIAFSASAIGRCIGMIWLLWTGEVTLLHVVALEAVCDGFACCMLAVGISVVLKSVARDKDSHLDDKVWWSSQRTTVAKFAVTAYLQHLATLPFGGNTNRLVGGVMFGDRIMATFGFAQSLYEYFKRYLPTQLLVGLIRPIVVARFSVNRNFSAAARLCDQALHVNLVFLSGAIAVLSISGIELLTLMSAGKYGVESVWLLISMLILLCLETQRLIIEVLTQTVERYGLMIPSNLFLSASVLVGIAGYPFIGALSFPIANALALLIANCWLLQKLKSLGFSYTHEWRRSGIVFNILCISIAAGLISKWLELNWIFTLFITVGVYVSLFIKYLMSDSISFIKSLVGK